MAPVLVRTPADMAIPGDAGTMVAAWNRAACADHCWCCSGSNRDSCQNTKCCATRRKLRFIYSDGGSNKFGLESNLPRQRGGRSRNCQLHVCVSPPEFENKRTAGSAHYHLNKICEMSREPKNTQCVCKE